MEEDIKKMASKWGTILYHQTSPAIAKKIIDEQKMIRGTKGLAGGGIYFADKPELTNKLTHHPGDIIKANVSLGKIMVVHIDEYPKKRNELESMTYTQLKNKGFNSVCLSRNDRGLEIIVYDWDQVKNITYYKKK